MINNFNATTLIIGIAYFLSLLNFFHAKFNLSLYKAFSEFASDAPPWINFLNSTLHITLIGSFVFMGFYVHQPISFIIANLAMRFCDLVMDIALLSVIDKLNISPKTAGDLKKLHINWIRGTLVFTVFFGLSAFLLSRQSITGYQFAVAFLILEILDLITDYYNNRKFYFGAPPSFKIGMLLNAKSKQYLQANEIVNVVNEKKQQEIRTWLKKTVDSSEAEESRNKVWFLEENGQVLGILGASIHPLSKALLIKYLLVKNEKSWLKVARLLIERLLRLNTELASKEPVTGILIDQEKLEEQVFPKLKPRLCSFLSQLGFQPVELAEKTYYFLPDGQAKDECADILSLVFKTVG